jgi:hypothetical protein
MSFSYTLNPTETGSLQQHTRAYSAVMALLPIPSAEQIIRSAVFSLLRALPLKEIICAFALYKAARYLSPYMAAAFLRQTTTLRNLAQRNFAVVVANYRVPIEDGTTLRRAFNALHLPEPKPAAGHQHGIAAASRTCVDDAFSKLAMDTGRCLYSVSASTRDARLGIRGERLPYFSKDLLNASYVDEIGTTDIAKMVDVDYYVDMPTKLATDIRPYVLYTYDPIKMLFQSSDEETVATVNSDNTVSFCVRGGTAYRHELWNYNNDHVNVNTPFGLDTITYQIDRRRVSPTHSMVFLIPRARIPRILSLFLATPRLTRRRLNEHAIYIETIGASVHFGAYGTFKTCVVRQETMRSIILSLGFKKKDIYPSDVQNLLHMDDKLDQQHTASEVLSNYAELSNHCMCPREPVMQSDYGNPAMRYTPLFNGRIVTEPQATGTIICSPLVDASFAPNRSYESDQATITERVVKVATNPKPLTPQNNRYVQEFITLLGTQHSIIPVDLEIVQNQQNRPTQRSSYEQVAATLFSVPFAIKTFMKSEAYPTIAPPRNISTTTAAHRVRWSAYMYALTRAVAQNPWYAFCKHPNDISKRIHGLCMKGSTCIATDFSKFDGTHNHLLSDFELQVCLYLFPPLYHDEITELLRTQHTTMARTAHGVTYQPGESRLSGSAETSIFNTLCNALVAYVTYRHDRPSIGPDGAYHCLGIYGGDDGLSIDVSSQRYQITASVFGLTMTAETRPTNAPVTFLARTYPNPSTSPRNHMDVGRAFGKFHFSPHKIPEMEGLARRATNIGIMDPNCPILVEWANLFTQARQAVGCPHFTKDQKGNADLYYAMQNQEEGFQYPCSFEEYLPAFQEAFGLSSIDIRNYVNEHFTRWSSPDTKPMEMFKLLVGRLPPTVKIDVVNDDGTIYKRGEAMLHAHEVTKLPEIKRTRSCSPNLRHKPVVGKPTGTAKPADNKTTSPTAKPKIQQKATIKPKTGSTQPQGKKKMLGQRGGGGDKAKKSSQQRGRSQDKRQNKPGPSRNRPPGKELSQQGQKTEQPAPKRTTQKWVSRAKQ